MKLLVETIFEGAEVDVVEEDGQPRKLFIKGPFSIEETKNNNGRIYPSKILEREINKFQELIETGQAIGELDHPESPKINLKNISHRITGLEKEGKIWYGKAQILESQPSGKQAAGLIADGVKLGISSRALGSLTNEDHGKIVNDDLHMITWDIVARPSFNQALLDAIYEAKEYEIIEGKIVEKIKDASKKDVEILLKEVKKWRDRYYSKLILETIIEKMS